MTFIKSLSALLVALIMLSSCSDRARATWHLKRAQSHIRKAEALGAKSESDTVYVKKTVLVPEVRVDTIVQSKVGDTIRIEKEKLRIKYVKLPGDSVYVQGKCISDTVRISVPFTVTKEISVPYQPRFKWWLLVISFLAGAVGYALIRRG
jgi:hypothetical protein